MIPSHRRLRLGVLFSGGGRTLENLAVRIHAGTLPAEIVVAIASTRAATGVGRAQGLGIPCHVVEHRERQDTFAADITSLLDAASVDLVLLAGFLKLYDYPPQYEGRILNIHPSLLPAFGGKGFYGDRVHEAAIKAGVKFSGCTVHFVTREYDRGPIVLQRIVPVHPQDSVHDLAARVFQEECQAFPEAIKLYAEDRLDVRDGKVWIRQLATV